MRFYCDRHYSGSKADRTQGGQNPNLINFNKQRVRDNKSLSKQN